MSVVLIKDNLPLLDKTEESIITATREVLRNQGVVRLVIDANQDTLDFWRVASEEEAAEKTTTFRDALRQIDMEEYVPTEGTDPMTQLFEMFEMVADAGCIPSHVLSGRGPLDLRKWVPISRKATSMFGVPLLFQNDLEHDVLIICGAKSHDATAADITYAAKVTLP